MIEIEQLESRQLFCGSVTPGAALPVTTAVATVHTDVSKALRPSQVLGTYKGNTHIKVVLISVSVGVTLELHASGSAYAGTLTLKGYGSFPFKVSSAQLLKLRQGTMTVPFNKSGEKGTVTVTIGKNAQTATGSFNASGTVNVSGTFDLTKTTSK